MVASGAMNSKNYKKWLKAIESELKNTRATTGSVAVVRSILNIPQKVTSTLHGLSNKYLIVVPGQDGGCSKMEAEAW